MGSALTPSSLSVVAVAHLSLSAATFVVYAWDKWAARRGARRVPESTLHLLAVLGGWPGALIARQALRHKTRKRPFRTVFWLTVAINCAFLALGLLLLVW